MYSPAIDHNVTVTHDRNSSGFVAEYFQDISDWYAVPETDNVQRVLGEWKQNARVGIPVLLGLRYINKITI